MGLEVIKFKQWEPPYMISFAKLLSTNEVLEKVKYISIIYHQLSKPYFTNNYDLLYTNVLLTEMIMQGWNMVTTITQIIRNKQKSTRPWGNLKTHRRTKKGLIEH